MKIKGIDTSFIISIISLSVAIWVAWHVHLGPGKIIGSFSYLKIWQFQSDKDGSITDRKITPSFWLANVGARPVLIQDIRMVFLLENGNNYTTYPVNYVPLEAIEEKANFNEYGRLSFGGPFIGFSLTNNERWVSSYNYNLKKNLFSELKGDIKVKIEVKLNGSNKWKNVLEDTLVFGVNPTLLQLENAKLGGVQSVQIHTKRWIDRRS